MGYFISGKKEEEEEEEDHVIRTKTKCCSREALRNLIHEDKIMTDSEKACYYSVHG
jgi:hypothetical protein